MFYHADNMSISRLVQLDIGEFDIGEKTEEHCESPLTCALKTIMLLSNNSLALVRISSHSFAFCLTPRMHSTVVDFCQWCFRACRLNNKRFLAIYWIFLFSLPYRMFLFILPSLFLFFSLGLCSIDPTYCAPFWRI